MLVHARVLGLAHARTIEPIRRTAAAPTASLSFLSLRESNRSATTTNERPVNAKRLFGASIRENTDVE